MKSAGLVAVLAALTAGSAVAGKPAPADYSAGVRQFDLQRWSQALPPLRRYYNEPGGELSDVAYMIGTSFCQLGDRDTGLRWLNYTLTFPLDTVDAQSVRAMLDCRPAATRRIPAPTAKWSINRAEVLYYGESATETARPMTRLLTRAALRPAPPPALDQPSAARYGACDIAAALWPGPRGRTCGGTGRAQVEIVGRYRFIVDRLYQPGFLIGLQRHLDGVLESWRTELKLPPPDAFITVVLARDPAAIAGVAARLHGLAFDPDQARGYSVAGDLTLVAAWDGLQYYSDSPLRRTLRHELFHIVVHNSFGDIPAWLDEGLAQYFSVRDPHEQRFGTFTFKLDSWGPMPGLRGVVDERTAFTDIPGNSGTAAPVPIAVMMMQADMARMFLSWADRQNRLGDLVAAFRGRDPGRYGQPGQSSAEIIERVLGTDLATIEATVRQNSFICVYNIQNGVWQAATARDRECFEAYNAPVH